MLIFVGYTVLDGGVAINPHDLVANKLSDNDIHPQLPPSSLQA